MTPPKLIWKPCSICGDAFRTVRGKATTCSPDCTAELIHRRAEHNRQATWPKPDMTELDALIKAGGPRYCDVNYAQSNRNISHKRNCGIT